MRDADDAHTAAYYAMLLCYYCRHDALLLPLIR